MNKEFEKLNKKLHRQFGKDRIMALATSVDDVPSVRIIDAYYQDECFYIVTHEATEKVQEIMKNKNVSLCTGLHEFQGEAVNIGHPLQEENQALRAVLTKEFAKWYFAHNNEDDPKMCYVKVILHTGFTHFNKIGYEVDFQSHEVKKYKEF